MEPIANDFTINIATANGTGSQSANLILLQSIFDMGVPVSGKNLFPSNISGLPTWYIVRLSDQGYQAPGDRTHIQVLVNPATWDDDLAALEPGSIVIWNENAKKEGTETGVIAQEVEALGLPGIVTTRDDGYKAVRYEKLVPLLIEAIKELNEIGRAHV